MHESAGRHPGTLLTLEADLEREFEDRLRESADLAVRIAYSVVRQRQDAEDIAQEAFAKAHRAFSQLRDRTRFRAWLVRMTWRLAIDRWRADARRRTREQAAFVPPTDETAEDVASGSERAARLWKAIDSLPEKLRLVIVLGAIQGYEVREMARLLDLPEGTVKSRLFLARKDLAQRLQCLANDTSAR
jgi:RNA polymerase sigma-70 factor (ECF subfamily)